MKITYQAPATASLLTEGRSIYVSIHDDPNYTSQTMAIYERMVDDGTFMTLEQLNAHYELEQGVGGFKTRAVKARLPKLECSNPDFSMEGEAVFFFTGLDCDVKTMTKDGDDLVFLNSGCSKFIQDKFKELQSWQVMDLCEGNGNCDLEAQRRQMVVSFAASTYSRTNS